MKICNLVRIGTQNRRVKFGLKIFNRLGKNVRKPRGIFLTHAVDLSVDISKTLRDTTKVTTND